MEKTKILNSIKNKIFDNIYGDTPHVEYAIRLDGRQTEIGIRPSDGEDGPVFRMRTQEIIDAGYDEPEYISKEEEALLFIEKGIEYLLSL